MPGILRSFTLPATLTPDRRERLAAALGALQARQHHLANTTTHVATVSEVRIEAEHIELHYSLDAGSAVSALEARPDGPTLEKWARQLCETLAAAYPAGQAAVLRHGALTCDALAVDDAGDLAVLDFGVAECFAAALDPAETHYVRQVAATVAPEVWATPGSFGQTSDIFSAGVVLYQLATGQHPHGANPQDPDDCKHRILIELPISAAEAGADVATHVSRSIGVALSSDPAGRFDTFADMLAALAGTGPAFKDPTKHLAADALDDSELEEHRRRYLEQQERLREQRQRSEKKWAARLEQVRRHWRILSVLTLLLAGAFAVGSVLWIRHSNRTVVKQALDHTVKRMNDAFGPDSGRAIATELGIDEPSQRLLDAVRDLHTAAPATVFVFDDPQCNDWRCVSGRVRLDLGGADVPLAFKRSANQMTLAISDDQLAQQLIEAGQQLAIAKMDPALRELIGRLRSAFDEAEHAADVERRLSAQLGSVARPLGYLGFQGEHARCNLGPLKPVVGRDSVGAEFTLLDADGRAILENITTRMIYFDYTCNQARTVCALSAVRIEPSTEPEVHKLWCMGAAIDAAADALASGDADAFARLTTPTRANEVQALLDWTRECSRVELRTLSQSAALDSADISIVYVPGMLNDAEFETAATTVAFDADHEWRIRTDQRIAWPEAPDELLRQQLGQAKLETFKSAWADGDAAAYLALFTDTRRSVEDIAGMFEQMTKDDARFEIAAREDPQSSTTLYIDIKPINAPSLSGGYVTKSFAFALDQGELRCKRGQDPLWIFAGRMYDSLVTRISGGPWDGFDTLRSEFDGATGDDMTADERAIVQQWLSAINRARQTFHTASDTYIAGLPERVQLVGVPGVQFKLVHLTGPRPHLFYIQERELAVKDIDKLWTKSTPWRDWPAVVGRPPAGQAVGLSFDEATELADRLGCQLPTFAEWNTAATAFGEQPGKPGPHAFYGGVWEFCTDTSETSTAPLVVGGCWHDYDPELLAGGLLPPQERSLLRRQDRFGTIGLRLCYRFDLPSEALGYAPAP